MPRAKTGNFTLRKVAVGVPAEKAAHRFAALQRSGQYSELRFIQRGKSKFDIVGYKWPDKGVRRKLKIGGAAKNPSPKGNATPNQVLFGQNGRTKVGWINRETPTRYQVTYKDGAQTRTVWRRKDKVKFQTTGKRGKVRNVCPKEANPVAGHLAKAVKLSETFHGFRARRVRNVKVNWPKALTLIGDCARVDYVCDKFDGKLRHYFHEFEGPCVLLAGADPQPDGDNLLLIKGKFKIKAEGLIG